MTDHAVTFTGQQAATAQTSLRAALGLAPEQFSVPAFIGMVSDEIQQLRAQGKTDDQIAALIEQSVGVKLPAETITRFYASPEDRRHPRE
jgi:hypothetical protein